MNIPIAGKDYKLISTDQDGIYIDYTDPDLPIIYAHALISIDDVISFIKECKPIALKKSSEAVIPLEYFKVHVFNQLYPVKIHRTGKQKTFAKQAMIHYFTSKKTDITKPSFEKKVIEDFFEETMIAMLSSWEDELQIMSNEILFKKLKSKPYLVDVHNQNICFNKNNSLLSLRANELIVYLAVRALQPLNTKMHENIARYFPDHEQLLKIIKHEYKGF